MTTYTVTNTIQSLDTSNDPVEIIWYKGDNLGMAMAAMVQAAARHADDDETKLPKSMRYKTMQVHLDIVEEES